MLDAVLYGRQGHLLEGSVDCRVDVEGAVVREMVELIFAKVQLRLCEDRFDRIPFRAVSLIVDEPDI